MKKLKRLLFAVYAPNTDDDTDTGETNAAIWYLTEELLTVIRQAVVLYQHAQVGLAKGAELCHIASSVPRESCQIQFVKYREDDEAEPRPPGDGFVEISLREEVTTFEPVSSDFLQLDIFSRNDGIVGCSFSMTDADNLRIESGSTTLAALEAVFAKDERIIWPDEYDQAAVKEGWSVFAVTSRGGDDYFSIQRIDDPEQAETNLGVEHIPGLKDDAAAVELVVKQAAAGDLKSLLALWLDGQCSENVNSVPAQLLPESLRSSTS